MTEHDTPITILDQQLNDYIARILIPRDPYMLKMKWYNILNQALSLPTPASPTLEVIHPELIRQHQVLFTFFKETGIAQEKEGQVTFDAAGAHQVWSVLKKQLSNSSSKPAQV